MMHQRVHCAEKDLQHTAYGPLQRESARLRHTPGTVLREAYLQYLQRFRRDLVVLPKELFGALVAKVLVQAPEEHLALVDLAQR